MFFQCGEKNKLKYVQELSPCTYKFVVDVKCVRTNLIYKLNLSVHYIIIAVLQTKENFTSERQTSTISTSVTTEGSEIEILNTTTTTGTVPTATNAFGTMPMSTYSQSTGESEIIMTLKTEHAIFRSSRHCQKSAFTRF